MGCTHSKNAKSQTGKAAIVEQRPIDKSGDKQVKSSTDETRYIKTTQQHNEPRNLNVETPPPNKYDSSVCLYYRNNDRKLFFIHGHKNPRELSALDQLTLYVDKKRIMRWDELDAQMFLDQTWLKFDRPERRILTVKYNGKQAVMKILELKTEDNPRGTVPAHALAEIIIGSELSKLVDKTSLINRTSIFPKMHKKWLISGAHESMPPMIREITQQVDVPTINCVFITEHVGGMLLDGEIFKDIGAWYSTIAQLTIGMCVAGIAVKLVHHDMSPNNVCSSETTEEYVHMILDGLPVAIKTFGISIKVIDFGLAQIERDGCVIVHNNNIGCGSSNPIMQRIGVRVDDTKFMEYNANEVFGWIGRIGDQLIGRCGTINLDQWKTMKNICQRLKNPQERYSAMMEVFKKTIEKDIAEGDEPFGRRNKGIWRAIREKLGMDTYLESLCTKMGLKQ